MSDRQKVLAKKVTMPIVCNQSATNDCLRRFHNILKSKDTAWPGICCGYHSIRRVVHDVDFASVLHFANVACYLPDVI